MGDPSFRFVHAADLHLDTPFKGLRAADPEVANALVDASLAAFDALVDLVIEKDAAFLLVAGDVYDGPERGIRAQIHFRDGLARLSERGVLSFVVHGNHDPVDTGWSALGDEWPEGVTVFPAPTGPGEPAPVVPVRRDGAVVATVQGVSYPRRDMAESLVPHFRRPEGPGFHVGLLHANVRGAASGYDDYSPCTLDELRAVGLDYWALGHIHGHLVLAGEVGRTDPFVVYPGNLQARSMKPSELGPKGAVVVEVVGGVVRSLEHVACDQVRFELLELDVSHLDSVHALCDALEEEAESRRRAARGRSLLLRARLIGRSNLHSDLVRPTALEDLLSSLRERAARPGRGPGAPFVYWEGLEDATRPVAELDELVDREDFLGDLARTARELAGAGPGAADIEALAAGVGPREARRRADALVRRLSDDPALWEDVVRRAAVTVLDRLEDVGDR